MVFSGALVVKDLAFSLLWLRFDPWPGNFYAVRAGKSTAKKNKNKNNKKCVCVCSSFEF